MQLLLQRTVFSANPDVDVICHSTLESMSSSHIQRVGLLQRVMCSLVSTFSAGFFYVMIDLYPRALPEFFTQIEHQALQSPKGHSPYHFPSILPIVTRELSNKTCWIIAFSMLCQNIFACSSLCWY
jgi:hypothetical protein